jgi:hypothetical protein
MIDKPTDRGMSATRALLPRIIRLRDTPFYLGMDRNRFNAEVRPYLTTIPIGRQGIAFDRLELDAWVEQYKARNGRPSEFRGELTWDEKDRLDSLNVKASGISTNRYTGAVFARALDQLNLKKQKRSSSKSLKTKGKQQSLE